MRIIAFINQKGGVGKTTSVVNVGAGLARLGKKTLVVDLDPQAHLTTALGMGADLFEATVHDLLKGTADLDRVVVAREPLRVAPASLELSGADIEFSTVPGREYLLREALWPGATAQGYDFVLVDCPPNLGLLTLNALTAAREVFIPVQTEYLALQSLSRLLETVELVRRRLNPDVTVTGIIATRYNRRKKLSREVAMKIREYFQGVVFKTCIRDAVALAEAPGFGQDIFEYRPGSSGAADYRELCQEILERQGHD